MTEKTGQTQTPDQIIGSLRDNPNYNPGVIGATLHQWLLAKGIKDLRDMRPLIMDRTVAEFWRELKEKASLPYDKKSFPISFKNEVRQEYLARLD